ncbi:hypothetical protein Tco_0904083, partial [Tanacetum coccineum]
KYKDNDRFWGSKSGGNESITKPFSGISNAKACMLAKSQASDASSKAKVQACGSKAKLKTSSSDISDDKKGSSKASDPIFEGPSVKGLLDWYGYNTVEEYLSWNYFPSTDKDITDENCIHESNYAMSKGKYVPVSQKHNPKVKSPVPVTVCVLGLANVTTWDEIVNKMGVSKSKICANKAKGKRKFVMFMVVFATCICSLHWQLAFAACICILHLKQAFAAFVLFYNKHLLCCKLLQQAFSTSICFAASYCNKHLQQAFAISICFVASYCNKPLQQAFATSICFAASYCNKYLHLAFALQLTFSASI